MKNVSVDYRKLVLPPSATLRKAIQAMTSAGGMVLVAKADQKLLGVVVDSDIRKGILRGLELSAPIEKVMNRKPFTLPFGLEREEIVRAFRREPRSCVPLVDRAGRVRELAVLSEYLAEPESRGNTVVLMVGGQGRRLLPLTQDRPKPLLQVGDRPILETIIDQFFSAGFTRFYLAVNHQADQIREHFGDGKRLGVSIRYVQERKPLGTAGALSLVPRKGLTEPLILMNGDLLTKIDFKALLDFHREEKNLATVCVREHDYQVPFGVVSMKDHRLEKIVEKPTQRYFVNAGIYVLEPKVLGLIRKGRPMDVPELLTRVQRRSPRGVGCFPIREYWIDIGRLDEYRKAQSEYDRHF
ncbi:MAG: nucleotidyltransferase family protein [Elusimicrobia bacterium]|nr:nucleotidyltransferase family protein [Elusimicrobiota bacterium]